jgi:uncharacterized protein (DUF488 family)
MAPTKCKPVVALWTIGHGTRRIEDFLAALRAHRIAVLADVRSYPVSRRNPQFTQAALAAALEGAGIQYAHFRSLGGFREGGYAAHMASDEWRAGFADLALLAEDERVAIGCSESLPAQCHRRFIARRAASLGWSVSHILDAQRTLPESGGGQATLDVTED